MAQTQALGHHQNRLDVPRWARENCNRAREAEVRMVSVERAFQAARLFYLDNRRIINRLDEGLESFRDQWTEVGDLRRTVEDQARTISALEIRLSRLERRERRRRSSGSSSSRPSNRSGSSLGSPVRGSVWSGSRTSANPYEVQEVMIQTLEPVEDEVVPIPVPPPRRRGGWGRYEGTDDRLRDPVEILQVNPDEDSLLGPLQRSRVLDEEGRIVPQGPLDYESPDEEPPRYEEAPAYD